MMKSRVQAACQKFDVISGDNDHLCISRVIADIILYRPGHSNMN